MKLKAGSRLLFTFSLACKKKVCASVNDKCVGKKKKKNQAIQHLFAHPLEEKKISSLIVKKTEIRWLWSCAFDLHQHFHLDPIVIKSITSPTE